MKIVNVPGAGPLSFPDSESDDSIYAKVAKIQDRLKQIDLETRPDPRDIPVGRVASNAFNRMGRGLGITALKEAPALASSLFGADDTARRLLDEAKTERQALEEKYPTSQRSFEGIRGLSDVGKFFVESGVEAIPPVAAIAGTGGIGALAGRTAAKYGTEAALARAAAQRGVGVEAAEAAAAAARSKATQTGLNTGLGTGSFGLNAPESFAGIYEETGGKLEPGLAMGAGAFKALFDSVLPARVMSQLGLRGQAKLAEELASRSTIVPDSFKLRLAKEIGKTALTESTTETLQEATDIIAEQLAGAPGGLSDPKNVDRLLMAAAKGGIGGTVIGAPSAVVQTARDTTAKEPEYSLSETKKADSVGPGPAENLAAAMAKLKSKEGITEDEFNLLVENKVLTPESKASVKIAAPRTDPALEEQTDTATANEAVQADQVARAAAAQASLQQQQEQNQQVQQAQQQNDQVRQDALAQAQAANQRRQEQQIAEYQAKQQAQQNVQPNAQPNVQADATPAPTVTSPSGASIDVPSEPGAGVPPAGVATSPPPRVAPAEQPPQQAGVGEAAQPAPVAKLDQPFYDNGRVMVISDVNGTRVPFYLSTGRGGKKTVPEGKWYPFFGYGADGWINKGTEKDINNFYGSSALAAKAEQLNSSIGDVRNLDYTKGELPVAWDGKSERADWQKSNSIIVNPNEGFTPVSYSDKGPEANKKFWDNITGTISKVEKVSPKEAVNKIEGTQPSSVAQERPATWSNKDTDIPVTVIGEPETSKDGKKFAKVRYDLQGNTGETYVPFEELKFETDATPTAATPATPTPVTPSVTPSPPAEVEVGSPQDEWDNQFRSDESEPTWNNLNKDLKAIWKDAHANKALTQETFDYLAKVQKSKDAEVARTKRNKEDFLDDLFQVTEGEAYPPVNDQFPISREEFARALGIKQHSKAWMATEHNAELADAVTKGDMKAVVQALLGSKNPIVRDIANRARVLEQFVQSRIKIKIADEELREEDAFKGYRPGSIAGMFDEGSNTILVNSVYAGSEHTIAHELVHGLTERLLRTAQGNQLKAVNRLKALYKDVLAKAEAVYKTKNIKELPYGFKSPSEFLAEGLSNPEFQYLLAALPHETKTSLWTQFVQAIADILGLKSPSALTELLDIYSTLVKEGPPLPNETVTGATRSALIGAPPPPNNNYPLVPDDLPENAKVPPTVSTAPTALPQVAVNRTMVGPMQRILDAPKDSEVYINAMDAVGRSAMSLQPMWYIAETARKLGFKQIGEIENSLRKAGAMKNTMLKRSSDFMTKALAIAKSDPAGKKAMDAFVNRASDLAIDVTRSKTPSPEFVKTRPDEVADYVSLRSEYDKLQPKFQKLASDLVDQYRQFRNDYFAALKKSINDQYQNDPVTAETILSGLDEKYKNFNEAYTPFVRIGDYWITYFNPNNGKPVAESYTSLGAQKTRLDELKKAGIAYVQSFKQTDFRKFSYKSGPVNQFFDEIKANVNKALPIFKDDSPATADRIREAREEMKERLYQASLLLHPESSMLRQFGLERKGTAGYIEDTLAAYDHKAPVYATQISQVANKGEIEHQIDSARKQNASNPDTKMSDIITHVAKVVYGVDTIRADDPLNQIANSVNRLGFTFYMGFNPASALVNMLQTPTVMFPLLAGEFHGLGQTKIMNTLFSAMTKIIGGSVGEKTYGEKLVESAEAKIDAAVAKGKTREEAIAALPEMERVFLSFRDQGILDAGDPSHDFGSVTKYGSGETSAFGKGTRAFTKYSAIMFQRAEAVNREAGALATYQLMKQRLSGKADMSNQEKYVEAIRKATDMVTRAHGDYQQGLAPKIFLSPTMRVIFMFKKFPAHMAALYIRLFKDMFSGADPEVRKVARIQFAGLMGMSSLFAGTMGMPFYFIVRDMMNLMLDDEDDPYDFDFAFYNYLTDMWGQPMANRITRGWLGDLGGDVASKVGYASSPLLGGTKQLPFIGGLLGLRDGKSTASTEDDLKNYVAEAAGASAGMALQIARGIDKLAQGDVYRFLEGVTPMAGMRNIAKSIRLSNEGALTTRGEPIIEDVSLIETALQAVGFTPQRLAGQYQLNAWQKDAEKQILARRQSLLNQYFNARTRGDFETASDVREEMRNFSMMNPEKGLAITEDTITASGRTRAQQSKDTKAGIYLSKPFRQRFAEVPVYAEE
jgi:hypothetical protein